MKDLNILLENPKLNIGRSYIKMETEQNEITFSFTQNLQTDLIKIGMEPKSI